MSTTITHEPHDSTAWVCICGNMPTDSGFFPSVNGREVEPDAADWDGTTYICARCCRVIDATTLAVVSDVEHIYSADDRCLNCDCRPWGKWASLPCGAAFDPTHPAHSQNDLGAFMAGFVAYSAAKEV